MRSIRNTVVAGAAAVALVLGTSTAVAEEDQATDNAVTAPVAEENEAQAAADNEAETDTDEDDQDEANGETEESQDEADDANGYQSENIYTSINKLAADLGSSNWNADHEAQGAALFGFNKDGFETQPGWAQTLYVLTVLGVVGSFIGLVVGPVYNFFVHGQ